MSQKRTRLHRDKGHTCDAPPEFQQVYESVQVAVEGAVEELAKRIGRKEVAGEICKEVNKLRHVLNYFCSNDPKRKDAQDSATEQVTRYMNSRVEQEVVPDTQPEADSSHTSPKEPKEHGDFLWDCIRKEAFFHMAILAAMLQVLEEL